VAEEQLTAVVHKATWIYTQLQTQQGNFEKIIMQRPVYGFYRTSAHWRTILI